MHAVRLVALAIASVLMLTAVPGAALDVTLDSGAGSLSITDNDINDLDITVGTVEFDVTVGGKLAARARVREEIGSILRIVNVAAILPDTHATFRNIDTAAATFTITINSSAYLTTGPPLGWTVYYIGEAADPTPDDVEITASSVEALVQPGPASVETVLGPVISPPVAPGLQPVAIAPIAGRSSDPLGTATGTRVVFTFTAGPGDEIRIPDSASGDGTGLEVLVYNQANRCIDRMNRRAEKIIKFAYKASYGCIKDVASNGGGPSAPCTSGLASSKVVDHQFKLLSDYDNYCAPVPAWGVNGGTCCDGGSNEGATCTMSSPDCDIGGTCTAGACMSGAAADAVRDMALDVMGTSTIVTGVVAKCQTYMIRRAGKLLEERWKLFRKCKKKNISTITDDTMLVSSCLGPPQPDSNGRIPRNELKVDDNVAACVASGVVPVASAFTGGACAGEADGTFGACVSRRTACRFCIGVNTVDDIVPPLDCDMLDDGVSNSSCP
jgi:hypothetical protein